MRDKLVNEYFEWISELVSDNKYTEGRSFRKLLMCLHSVSFRYPRNIPHDGNRAEDGVNLRYRFAHERGYSHTYVYSILTEPCSVLEMMIALAIRCEEHIMEDTDIGDRKAQWFWDMIKNLDLYSMDDKSFDKTYVLNTITILLDRKYRADGVGGLFTVPNCRYDLRNIEIWYQMCWYLNSYI